MGLAERIEEDYKKVLREGDKVVREVLRVVKTALMNAEIEKRTKNAEREAKLSDEEIIPVLKRQVKQLEEARELFQQGGRDDLVKQNDVEIEILKRYVPAQLDESKIREIAQRVVAKLGKVTPSDFGKVMGAVMKETKGQADGNVVSKVVKELLG